MWRLWFGAMGRRRLGPELLTRAWATRIAQTYPVLYLDGLDVRVTHSEAPGMFGAGGRMPTGLSALPHTRGICIRRDGAPNRFVLRV